MEENRYLTLIYRRLEGTITDSEQTQLDRWVNGSPANQQTYDDVVEAWNASENLSAEVELDLDAEFSFLEERMEDGSQEATEHKGPTLVTSSESDTPSQTSGTKVAANAEQSSTVPQITPKRKTNIYWAVAATVIMLITAIILGPRLLGGDPELQWVEFASAQGKKEIVLEDQTTVILAEGSTLRYPEKFEGEDRPVELNGVAYFKVAENPEKPFQITTEATEITVLGTEFNVNAPSGGVSTRVSVSSGKVQFRPLDEKGEAVLVKGKGLILTKGEAGTYNKSEKKLTKATQFSPNETFWMTGKLVFDETPLGQAFEEISEFYEVEIELADPSLKTCPISAAFEDVELDEILETIAAVFAGTFEKTEEGKYIFKGGQC